MRVPEIRDYRNPDAMRLVIVPKKEALERIKPVSEPFECMEPFFDFTVSLRIFRASQDWTDPLGFDILLEFAIPIPVIIHSMSAKLTTVIHNQFTKWADRTILMSCSFNNCDLIFCFNNCKFIDCQDFS